MIVDKIKEKINNQKIKDKNSTLGICLYLLLEEKDYRKGFNHLRIMEVDSEYMLYVPKSNFAAEFMNNNIPSELIVDFNAYGIRNFSNDYDDCDIKKYIKNSEKENIEKLIAIIQKSESAKDLYDNFNIEILKNDKFIHDINRYIFQEKNSFKNSNIEIIENICLLKKGNFKESMYIQDFNSKIYPRDISYIEHCENRGIEKKLPYIKNNTEIVSFLIEKKEIEKVFLIGQKNKAKKYLTDKFDMKTADILLSNKSAEEKYLEIIEDNYKKEKDRIIEEIKKIDNYEIIEDIPLLNDNKIKKIVSEIKKEYLNKDSINIEILENIKEIDLTKKLLDNTKLNFLNNIEYYLMFQGVGIGVEYFSKESERLCNYIILKNDNEMVGYLAYQEENNLIKIESIEIFKSQRNKGLSKKLFETLADFSIRKNKVIYNTIYSLEGIEKLPKTKKELNEKMNCLFIDEDCRSFNREHYYLNKSVIDYIRKQTNFNLIKFKEIYVKNLNKSNDEIKEKDLFSNIIQEYEKNNKQKLKLKN